MKNAKMLREKIKITQREMAKKLGLDYSMYNKYENGRNEPNLKTLEQIADFFGVSVDELIGHECDMLNRRTLTPEQREMLNYILNFTPKQQSIALGYMRRINEEDK